MVRCSKNSQAGTRGHSFYVSRTNPEIPRKLLLSAQAGKNTKIKTFTVTYV